MTPQKARELITKIRCQYPSPDSYTGNNQTGYCVAGGWLKSKQGFIKRWWTRKKPAYPCYDEIRPVLMEANPALSFNLADDYARKIVYWNDTGNFPMAWKLLEMALCATRKGKPIVPKKRVSRDQAKKK